MEEEERMGWYREMLVIIQEYGQLEQSCLGCYQAAEDCEYCECDQGKKGLNEKVPQLQDVSLLSAPTTET